MHLLLGDLELLQACRDLLERQKAALLSFRDETAKLLEFRDRCLVTQQSGCLIAQPSDSFRITDQRCGAPGGSGSLSFISPSRDRRVIPQIPKLSVVCHDGPQSRLL